MSISFFKFLDLYLFQYKLNVYILYTKYIVRKYNIYLYKL
jgi:hypothetical protein